MRAAARTAARAMGVTGAWSRIAGRAAAARPGAIPGAETTLERALRPDPAGPQARGVLGLALHAQGRPAGARPRDGRFFPADTLSAQASARTGTEVLRRRGASKAFLDVQSRHAMRGQHPIGRPLWSESPRRNGASYPSRRCRPR